MKLRRNNEYMFQVVECNTYMKRIKDGKYIRHSEQYSDVYYYVDENAEEKERKVEKEVDGLGEDPFRIRDTRTGRNNGRIYPYYDDAVYRIDGREGE